MIPMSPIIQQDPRKFWEQLEKLRDIHLPDPPGWFPPAPGWWLLLALLISGSILIVLELRARRRNLAPIREALGKLVLLRLHLKTGSAASRANFLQNCNTLMKRIALTIPRGERNPASLYGEAWRGFLIETGPRKADPPPMFLTYEHYRPDPEIPDPDAVVAWVSAWIRSQRK